MKRLLRLSLLPLLSMALAFSCQKIELPDGTADEFDELGCLPVELPTTGRNLRGLLNLYDHPEYFNQYIAIQGKLTTYFRVVGLKSPTAFAFIAPPENSGGDNESGGGDEEEGDEGQGGSDGDEEKPDNPPTDGKNYPQISDSLTIIAGR